MKTRILSIILASLLTVGMVGAIVATADDNDHSITLPDDKFITSTVTTERVFEESGTGEGDEPIETIRAAGIVFKAESGYFASTYTGYVGGVGFHTTVETLLGALEKREGIEVRRDKTLGTFDEIQHGDKLVLTAEDGTVKTELEIIIMGNADKSNAIDLSDVTAMLKVIAKWNVEIDAVAADVNGDGAVDLSDVTSVLKHIAGWKSVEFVKKPVLPGRYQMVATGDVPCHKPNPDFDWTALCLSDGIHYDLAVKFNVTADQYATSIAFRCPSWDDNKGKMTISVYKWNGDYDSSVAEMPIVSETYVDYTDNATLILDMKDASGKGLVEGEYIWRIHDGSDAGDGTGVGIWYFPEFAPAEDTGMKTFLNCKEYNIGPVANIFYSKAK